MNPALSFVAYLQDQKDKSLFEHILNESFKDAQRVFAQQADPQEVNSVLTDFKTLAQQGKIQGDDRDITKWMKRPFDQLKSTVNIAKQTPSNKEAKKSAGQDALKLPDVAGWKVIIPKSKEASCKYGAGTQWCVAATKTRNYFNDYFNDSNVTLIYFINANTKFALALHSNGAKECFDAMDKKLSLGTFLQKTGISKEQLDDTLENHVSGKVSPHHYQGTVKLLPQLQAKMDAITAKLNSNEPTVENIITVYDDLSELNERYANTSAGEDDPMDDYLREFVSDTHTKLKEVLTKFVDEYKHIANTLLENPKATFKLTHKKLMDIRENMHAIRKYEFNIFDPLGFHFMDQLFQMAVFLIVIETSDDPAKKSQLISFIKGQFADPLSWTLPVDQMKQLRQYVDAALPELKA